jgi:hypothetical protein
MSHNSYPLRPRLSIRSDMLPPMSPLLPLPPATSSIRLDKVPRRVLQVMIPSIQLLEIMIINQALPPKMLKQSKIRPRRLQRLSKHSMLGRQMQHPSIPTRPPILTRIRPVAQRTLHRPRRVFAAKMAFAVYHPLVAVLRNVPTAQEPKHALEHRRADLRPRRQHQDALPLFQQRHTRKMAREARTNRRLGRRSIRIARSQRRRMRRQRSRLVNQRRRHGRTAPYRAGELCSQGTRGRGDFLERGINVKMYAGKTSVNVRCRLAHPPFCLRTNHAF